MTVEDARGREEGFTLDKNGVCWRHWGGPESWRGIDAQGIKNIGHDKIQTYIKEVEMFIKEELEAQDQKPIDTVKVFDYRLRMSMDIEQFKARTINLDDGLDAMIPVTHPHVDQSFQGSITRVREHMGDQATKLLERRFRIINVWKPLSTVGNWPLAFCDTGSVELQDLVPTDLVRRKYVGETFYSKYNPAHRWYYLSSQEPNEVTMLKIHDSDKTARVRFCLHSSFQHPAFGVSDGRESFEVRALVFDRLESV